MKSLSILIIIACLMMACKTPDARKPVSISSGSFLDESIARNKKLAAREEARIQKIISKDTINQYIASAGGFWYFYNSKDTISNRTPKFGDVINFNYDIKDLNGNLIYSAQELDTITYAVDKEELFLGLREGLKLMKAGETVTFLFPSYQAFGYYGDDHKIGTNIPLQSKVTLHNINKQSTTEN